MITTLMSTADAAAFVARFRAFWARPDDVPLSTILTPDVRLVQPLTREVCGLPAAQRWRQRLFSALPSLRADVDGWSVRGDLLFISFHLLAVEPTFRIEWPAVDRFRLRAGRACERITYFDSLAVLAQVARQPRTWPRFLRWAGSEWRADAGTRPP